MPFRGNANVETNYRLRIPQRDAWSEIGRHFADANAGREIGVVLPVGCGKSGLMAITPFAVAARRVLIIAPGTRIRDQLDGDLRSNSETNFYERFGVLASDQAFPESVVVASGKVNLDDLRHCDVAIANIQQISGEENRWLDQLDQHFFDSS